MALNTLNLEIRKEKIFCLLGQNGTGNKCMSTLLIPTEGYVQIDGKNIYQDLRETRQIMIYILGGERGLYYRLTGRDNAEYFAETQLEDVYISYLQNIGGCNHVINQRT